MSLVQKAGELVTTVLKAERSPKVFPSLVYNVQKAGHA